LGDAQEREGGSVDIAVLQLDIRVLPGHLCDDASPQTRCLEDVGLVHGADLPASPGRTAIVGFG
jgi:hypothetical protein